MYPRLSTAVGDAVEFKRVFGISFRPLVLLAVLGAVGTYLFADVPVALIYSLEKFGPAADILRAFAPVLLLMYVDMLMGMAIVAAGKSVKLAIVKVGVVALTTGLVFVLVPLCQARFANGGLGVMYALAIGELMMLVAAGILIREAVDGHNDPRRVPQLARGRSHSVAVSAVACAHAFFGHPAVYIDIRRAVVAGRCGEAVGCGDIARLLPETVAGSGTVTRGRESSVQSFRHRRHHTSFVMRSL